MVQIVDGELEFNETNQNAMGGTEIIATEMAERISKDVLDGIQIIHSRPREIYEDMKTILVLHDLPGDPEIEHLRNGGWNDYDKLVFVSHWQQEMYNIHMGVPYSAGVVIKNAIKSFPLPSAETEKTEDCRLIYHTTPHRGLELLFPVYQRLYEEFGDKLSLDVFSSFEIYGWGERDLQYENLFKELKAHPGISYHGSKPNSVVREYLWNSDVFAYPSIWPETSCLSLLEAMSAGLDCVHPAYGALTETSMNLNFMYGWNENAEAHADLFYKNLKRVVENNLSKDYTRQGLYRSMVTQNHYDWDVRIPQWENFLKAIK